ncbi:ornithine cyclodeaminase family protein [Roseibium sp.]|uniref:ornithine cyclodeaminase family protein n=1 Tax=Roseibium sp. TaxID=1936156 RepID=UPI003B5234B5
MPVSGGEGLFLQILSLPEIKPLLDMPAAIETVRQILIDTANGLIAQPEPVQILFDDQSGSFCGDCHIKAAQAKGLPYFAVKVATGFYQNSVRGLEVNNGLVLVLSSETGEPLALLQDEGWLTQMRTAAAGALAASLKDVPKDGALGIIGTGTQARLQAEAIRSLLGIERIFVLGRTSQSITAYLADMTQSGFRVSAVDDAKTLCWQSDILVTATPATSPVICADDVSNGLHIVAVGADSPGKCELAPDLFAQTDIIVTENHSQCLDHGDFGSAVRVGHVHETADHSLCNILAGQHPDLDFGAASLSIVDLTGLGAQDLAVASAVVTKKNLASPRRMDPS